MLGTLILTGALVLALLASRTAVARRDQFKVDEVLVPLRVEAQKRRRLR